MSDQEDLKRFETKSGNLKSKLTIFSKYFYKCKGETGTGKINLTDFHKRYSRIENVLDEFYDFQTEIEILKNPDDEI